MPLVHTRAGAGAGEVVVIGGGCGASQQRIDVYTVATDSWRSLDTGVYRQVPSAALLPDGRAIIVNGENGNIDQTAAHAQDGGADPRYVQLFDPETMTVHTESVRSTVFRGYHNALALLPDATLLTGTRLTGALISASVWAA